MAAFAFNASILLAMVLIPLLYPEALTRMTVPMQMVPPPVPVAEPKPMAQPERAPAAPSEIRAGGIMAPPRIPTQIWVPDTQEPATGTSLIAMVDGPGTGSSMASPDNPFSGHGAMPTFRPPAAVKQHVSSGVMEGMLVNKVLPQYPAIARAVRLGGTVVLAATISRNGTIENLHVVGGPQMLQQAAIDAVKQWRYRPYLLNGEPVEVETTVNVQFTMQ